MNNKQEKDENAANARIIERLESELLRVKRRPVLQYEDMVIKDIYLTALTDALAAFANDDRLTSISR